MKHSDVTFVQAMDLRQPQELVEFRQGVNNALAAGYELISIEYAATSENAYVFRTALATLGKPVDAAPVMSASPDNTALVDLLLAAQRFRQTPVVDDDFPEIRDDFDRKLRDALARFEENVGS